MDIKKTIDDLVKKIQVDKIFSDLFSKNPVKAIEETLGTKLPDDQLKSLVDGVKAKVSLDQAGDALDKVKGLFGK